MAYPVARVPGMILEIRNHRVMLDADLASLYGVETRALVQAVKRNGRRFPEDFMFQLDLSEHENLRSQSVISSWGGRRSRPLAFTEQGVAMLSSVLRSERAIQVNVQIVRAFVRMRQLAFTHEEVVRRLKQLEEKMDGHDRHIGEIFRAIRELMEPPGPKPRRIGFHAGARRREVGVR